jgi:hypothetical protein
MLSTPFLVALVVACTQWAVKPLLASRISPNAANWNNIVRLSVALLSVVVVEINSASVHALSLASAWGLLPAAAAVSAAAIASYHVITDGGTPTPPAPLPADAPHIILPQ